MPASIHTAAYKLFCRRLVEARSVAGLSQREAAVKLGWPQSRLSRMETRERRVDVVELMALAKTYRTPILFFFA